jgi:hypothetical protein
MRVLMSMIIGGVVGCVMGYFGRLYSDACPLVGNPVISISLGAIAGLIIILGIL